MSDKIARVSMETFHEGDVVIADAGDVLAVSVIAVEGRPGLLDEVMVRRLRARLSEWILKQQPKRRATVKHMT